MSGHDMDIKLGLHDGACHRIKKQLGLKVPKKVSAKFRSDKLRGITSSTPKIDRYLKRSYLKVPLKRMATIIGRNDTFVATRMRQLGLKTPRHIIKKFIAEARIKKGHVPLNKGKKQTEYMSAEAIAKTADTRFKKGNINHNSLHDGAITIRQRKDRNEQPHKYIRISKGIWKELQIYNWEKKNGPVPKGHVLACKDGNTLNCKPSNWYLMTKVDNMKRNSSSLRLTDGYVAFTIVGRTGMDVYEDVLKNKDLIELKRAQLKLNRTIKSKTT
jgi:hypothetical protein